VDVGLGGGLGGLGRAFRRWRGVAGVVHGRGGMVLMAGVVHGRGGLFLMAGVVHARGGMPFMFGRRLPDRFRELAGRGVVVAGDGLGGLARPLHACLGRKGKRQERQGENKDGESHGHLVGGMVGGRPEARSPEKKRPRTSRNAAHGAPVDPGTRRHSPST
jgi:hypothetical protein